MIRHHKTHIGKPTIITFFILLLLAIGIGIYIYRSSHRIPSNQVNTPQVPTIESKQQSETEVFANVNNTTRDYILKKYQEAKDISIQSEYVGSGYGIINVSYLLNNENNKRKVYIAYYDSKWTVIHEDENKISCSKVRELVSTETILNSFCI